MDAYLAENDPLWEEACQHALTIPPALRERPERARREFTPHAYELNFRLIRTCAGRSFWVFAAASRRWVSCRAPKRKCG